MAAGAKIKFVPLSVTVPLVVLPLTIARVPPGVCDKSLISGLKAFVLFSKTVYASGFASGGILVTTRITAAVGLR